LSNMYIYIYIYRTNDEAPLSLHYSYTTARSLTRLSPSH
jgi:hypothetical protein